MKQGEGTAKNVINKRRSRNYELGEEGSTCCTNWNVGRSSLGLAPQCRKCLLHSRVRETLREYGPTEDRSEEKEGIKVVLERTDETPTCMGHIGKARILGQVLDRPSTLAQLLEGCTHV